MYWERAGGMHRLLGSFGNRQRTCGEEERERACPGEANRGPLGSRCKEHAKQGLPYTTQQRICISSSAHGNGAKTRTTHLCAQLLCELNEGAPLVLHHRGGWGGTGQYKRYVKSGRINGPTGCESQVHASSVVSEYTSSRSNTHSWEQQRLVLNRRLTPAK